MSETIAEEFRAIQRQMLKGFREPKRISFSTEGYRRMLLETPPSTDGAAIRKTYMGLPYEVRPEQVGRVALHDNAPGRQPAMSAAQLCDIIRGWLDADDPTHWGAFEKALDRAVVQHGRFE